MKKKHITGLSLSAIALLNLAQLNADTAVQEAETVNITLPKVVQAPTSDAVVIPAVKVVVDGQTQTSVDRSYESRKQKGIGFSKRVPPKYDENEKTSNQNTLVGDVKDSRVSAYLRSSIMPKDEVEHRLKRAGFTILARYELDKKGTSTSIVFTDEEMASSSAKDMKGFAGTLRVLIDEKNNIISINNPLYVMKAFMQDDYNSELAEKTLHKLRDVFAGLENSKDLLKVTRLEHYQFMMGLPYYEDMIEVAAGKNEALLQKARQSKKIVYEHHLNNGSIVLGVKLSKRTSKFVKKIGDENGGLLPYPILIEEGKAKILAPKYYIAVMYPMLSMSEFMGIATVPGAIEKECDKVFR